MSDLAPLTIRPAEPGDVPLLLTLIRELAEYERLLDKVTATEADYQRALFGPDAHVEAALAEVAPDATPVGYMVWFRTFSTFWARPKLYLEDVYVRPEFRGRGYGKAMLGHLAQRAIAAGAPRMHWQVLDWNTPSIEFYQRLGAEVHGHWLDCTLDRPHLERLAENAPRQKKSDES